MFDYIKTKRLYRTTMLVVSAFIIAFSFSSCDPSLSMYEFELPDASSIADETPPVANFSYAQGEGLDEEWKDYTFANLSSSATTYAWDFGDGNTSTDVDGANTYSGEGTWTVTLTASDALGVVSTYSEEIVVVEPEAPAAIVPDILEASFEDNSLPDGTGDGRDSWRNSDLGGVIQITSSPVHQGAQAAKFPSAGDRIAYQELTVTPNADYILTYYYTIKESNPGSITVAVIAGGSHTDLTDAQAATIESHVGDNQDDASTYVQATVEFNSGPNDTVSILVYNEGEEARVDTFSIIATE